jgi:acetyl-CoA C-acetyltransferase
MALREVSIIGIACTPFKVLEGETVKSMGTAACIDSIANAGIDKKDIEAFYIGNVMSGMLGGQNTIAPLILNSLGLRRDIPCTTVEGACGSSSIALREGWMQVATGMCDIVLVAGVEKLTGFPTTRITSAMSASLDQEVDGKTGLTFPGFWALIARRHMYEYGTTIKQIAMVAVKNHKNSVLNPRARFRNEVTLEQVMNSRIIADPIKLYDCCPLSDGASAAILCPSDRAKEFAKKPIDIIGIAQTTGYISLHDQPKQTYLPATVSAARRSFEMAGITPGDVDVAELHDCFTPAEIVDSEDLGFFEKGKGGQAVEDGITQVDGKLPINPSGGLLAKGHPVGATGIGQVYEVVKQLRGEHENQVKNAEIGLTHNAGGSGSVCTVTILRRR